MKQALSEKLFFSLKSVKPEINTQAGSLTVVTAKEAPGFVNIAFANLHLKKLGSLEPIWHPSAHKIGYCTQGKVLVTMRTPAKEEIFTVEKGEIFFIPSGYVHQIHNLVDESIIQFALNHAQPEMMRLSLAVDSISDSVFNATFQTKPGFVEELKKLQHTELITMIPVSQEISSKDSLTSSYKFNIGKSGKPILTKGGYLQVGTKKSLPVLDGLGILGFGLHPKGVVEPHWHTNAGELVYIVKGRTRITVLSPDGHADVMEVSGGEGAFAPASYFHNIENIGSEEVEVIAFFSHAEPDYIGIGEVMGTYSNDSLAAIFNVEPKVFEGYKKPKEPLVIVPI